MCAGLVTIAIGFAFPLPIAALPPGDDAACEAWSNPCVISITGLTIPSRQAELAFATAGVVQRMAVEVGQSVDEGSLIAELTSDIERCMLEKRRIAAESTDGLRIAEIEAEMKKEEAARTKELMSSSAGSPWELRQAEFARELAVARVAAERTKQQLDHEEFRAAEAALRARQIVAPFAGIVARTLQDTGEAVDSLKPVAVLVKLDPLWVELDVPAEHAGRIAVGQRALIHSGVNHRQAAVCEVEPLVDSGSMTFRARIAVPNKDLTLIAGMPVVATIELPERGVPQAILAPGPERAAEVGRTE